MGTALYMYNNLKSFAHSSVYISVLNTPLTAITTDNSRIIILRAGEGEAEIGRGGIRL